MGRVRGFLLVEALAFWMASLVHSGVLIRGDEHQAAMIAEGGIGTVLALGLAISLIDVRSTRVIGSAVQVFALLGTLVGIFAIVIGVGPQSRFDMVLHALFATLLVAGITVARVRTDRPAYD